jgi:hypothetical protein
MRTFNSHARKRALFVAVALGLVAAAAERPASAQRGGDFTLDEELTAAPHAGRGFPGLLDTEVAPHNGWVANLPSTSLYYGVTSRVTIGTLAAAAPLLFVGPAGLAAHARYRLASTHWFRTTLDGLMIAARVKAADDQAVTRLGFFGSNTEVVLSPRNRLLGHAWLGHGTVGNFFSAPMSGTALALGASYAAVLREWASLQMSVLYMASLTGSLTPEGQEIRLDFLRETDPHKRLIFRAVCSLRTGRWLFDVGALMVGATPLPWLNVAVHLGGAP